MENGNSKAAPRVEVVTQGKFLVVRIPMKDPFPLSATEKSLTVATSHGVQETALKVEGETLMVNLTAYIKNKNYVKPKK